MSANGKVATPVTGNSSLVRPRFSPGLLLRDDDLRQGVDYTRDLSRLLFRSLFGCGVVCGLEVSATFSCGKLIVMVAAGVALDCMGDPVYVPDPASIPLDPSCGDPLPTEIWVVIKRTEKCCAPRSAACSCDDEETPAVCTRERDCYEIRIVSECPKCACGCCPDPKAAPPQNNPQTAPTAPAALVAKKTTKKKVAADLVETTPTEDKDVDCRCVDLSTTKCYDDHYNGKCSCECCDDEWVLLAHLKDSSGGKNTGWTPDHSVRRFVRPVLMRDPVAWAEKLAAEAAGS
jgi:hypothetical protein